MNASELLQWQNMIFLLPFGLSAFLLLLSSLRLGGHRGGHGAGHGGGHGIAHGHAGHSTAGHGTAHSHGNGHSAVHRGGHTVAHSKTDTAAKDHALAKNGAREKDRAIIAAPPVTITNNFIRNFTGLNRAPLVMLLEAFFMAWGLCGIWANHLFLHEAAPTPGKILPSLAVGFVGGLIGARIAAEIIGRMMPQDETQSVSRNNLFGMAGKIAFPVSETAGRIHVYDSFGTLHDETCRVAAGHPPIQRGRRALVMDMDAQGKLIVEEVPETTP